MTLSPRRTRINLFWRFYDGNVRRPEFVSFLRHLRRTLKTPLVVVMDRLNVHRSAIRLLQDERARWFDPELLPAYAPDLNPVEAVWSCAKRADLANLAAEDLFDVGDAAGESLVRQRRDLRIRRSYFKTAQLPI